MPSSDDNPRPDAPEPHPPSDEHSAGAVLARLAELGAGDRRVADEFLGWLVGDDPARAARVLDRMIAFKRDER